MNSIGVFYHCYIPDDYNSSLWHILIDDQLNIVQNSGLSRVANINVCITMPKYWEINHGERFQSFQDYVSDYIRLRYPFVHIIDIRDTGEENIYEGHTLAHLHRYCIKNPDHDILYFHTKGITVNRLETKLWRNILDEVMVNHWQQRYLDLKDADCLGVSYRNMDSDAPLFSGNYFWAKAQHVALLEEPISNDRYYFEHWIHENEPRRKFVMDLSDKNMYDDIHIYGKLI